MKRILTMITICLAANSVWAKEIDWQQNYDTALAKAKHDKKILMVDIYADWCGWCKRLDAETYTDKNVQAKLDKDFIAVKISPEKSAAGQKLAQQLGARGFPFLAFVDATGTKVGQIVGYLPAADFLKQLERVSQKTGAQ